MKKLFISMKKYEAIESELREVKALLTKIKEECDGERIGVNNFTEDAIAEIKKLSNLHPINLISVD
jgi:hypothetical protein